MDSELYRPFNLCFKVLRAQGAWQDGKQTWKYFFAGYLVHFMVVELYVASEAIVIFTAKELIDIVGPLGFFLTRLVNTIKWANFLINFYSIMALLESLEQTLVFAPNPLHGKRVELKEQVALVYKIFVTYSKVVVVVCAVGALKPILTGRQLTKMWFPFDSEVGTVGFWVATAFSNVNIFFYGLNDSMLAFLPIIFISFAVGLIKELATRLQSCDSDQEFVKCVEIHLMIKKLVGDIQEVFSSVIFVQGFMGSIFLCARVFTLSIVSNFHFFFVNFTLKKISGKRLFKRIFRGFLSYADNFRHVLQLLFLQRNFRRFFRTVASDLQLRVDRKTQEVQKTCIIFHDKLQDYEAVRFRNVRCRLGNIRQHFELSILAFHSFEELE